MVEGLTHTGRTTGKKRKYYCAVTINSILNNLQMCMKKPITRGTYKGDKERLSKRYAWTGKGERYAGT
jgi:hypothetical protein